MHSIKTYVILFGLLLIVNLSCNTKSETEYFVFKEAIIGCNSSSTSNWVLDPLKGSDLMYSKASYDMWVTGLSAINPEGTKLYLWMPDKVILEINTSTGEILRKFQTPYVGSSLIFDATMTRLLLVSYGMTTLEVSEINLQTGLEKGLGSIDISTYDDLIGVEDLFFRQGKLQLISRNKMYNLDLKAMSIHLEYTFNVYPVSWSFEYDEINDIGYFLSYDPNNSLKIRFNAISLGNRLEFNYPDFNLTANFNYASFVYNPSNKTYYFYVADHSRGEIQVSNLKLTYTPIKNSISCAYLIKNMRVPISNLQ